MCTLACKYMHICPSETHTIPPTLKQIPRYKQRDWTITKGLITTLKNKNKNWHLTTAYLRLPTDVNAVSSIFYASFDHWLTIKSVLRRERKAFCSNKKGLKLSYRLGLSIQTQCTGVAGSNLTCNLCQMPCPLTNPIFNTYWSHTVENYQALLAHHGQWFLYGHIGDNDFNVCSQLWHRWKQGGNVISVHRSHSE